MARKVKVAVVGSGLAGLTAAYLLTKERKEDGVEFEVHVFEKSPSIGMDSSSISLQVPGSQKEWRVDVPMRSFQGGYYPQLIAMYKSLGVAFRQADFSYSFSLLTPPTKSQTRRITTSMIYNGASGRSGVSMPSSLADAYNSSKDHFYTHIVTRCWVAGVFVMLTAQLLLCYLRTLLHAMPLLRSSTIPTMTFGQWAEETTPKNFIAAWIGLDVIWVEYTATVLVPLFSAVCTAPEADVIEHPVEEFLDYIWLTFGTHHYVVVNGVRDVVGRLTSSLRHIHLSSPIASIHPDKNNERLVSIHCVKAGGPEIHTGFHHLIFATQASSAIPLLKSYLASLPLDATVQRRALQEQVACLHAFRYCQTIVINHTDDTLLPDDAMDKRDLNLISLDWEARIKEDIQLDSHVCVPSTYTMATHILEQPAGYPVNLPQIYQTTNPIIPPKEDSVLSIARLERAVVTLPAKEALKGLYHEEDRQWWQCAGQGRSRPGSLQGAGRLVDGNGPGVWICGSFAYAGIPLLEGCVVSARNVVEQGVFESEGITLQSEPWIA